LFCWQGEGEDFCYEEGAAIWGSFDPVLSLSRHRVYRNQKCAKCHDVHDGVPFDKVLACKPYNHFGVKSFEEILIQAYSDFNNSGCMVNFFLPKEAKTLDLRQIRCHPELYSTYFYADLFPTSNRIQLCEDGPLMPYGEGTWFRNFYCSFDDIPRTTCDETGFYRESFAGKGVGSSIMLLLGENVASEHRSTGEIQVHQEACLSVSNKKVGKFTSCI